MQDPPDLRARVCQCCFYPSIRHHRSSRSSFEARRGPSARRQVGVRRPAIKFSRPEIDALRRTPSPWSVTAGRERLIEALLFQCAARASKEPSSRCPRSCAWKAWGLSPARHSPPGPARLDIRRYTLSPSHTADEVDLPPPTTRMMTWPAVSVKTASPVPGDAFTKRRDRIRVARPVSGCSAVRIESSSTAPGSLSRFDGCVLRSGREAA